MLPQYLRQRYRLDSNQLLCWRGRRDMVCQFWNQIHSKILFQPLLEKEISGKLIHSFFRNCSFRVMTQPHFRKTHPTLVIGLDEFSGIRADPSLTQKFESEIHKISFLSKKLFFGSVFLKSAGVTPENQKKHWLDKFSENLENNFYLRLQYIHPNRLFRRFHLFRMLAQR